MPLQYDRGIRVLVIPPQDLGTDAITLPPVFNARPPVNGLPYEPQFHIQFAVQKTLTPAPNGFTVRLYNLAQTTRDTISGTVRRLASWLPAQDVVKVDGVLRAGGQEVITQLGMAQVRVDAGWSGALQEVMTGTVERVRTYWQGQDRVTELQGTDGGFNLAVATANRVFPPQTPALAVLEYLAETLGLRVAQTTGLAAIGGFKLVSGLNCSGDCAKAISDICDALQLSWWVEDGQVWILGDGESLPGQPIVVSPKGIPNAIRLYRAPEVMENGALKIDCALATDLRVGHLVVLAASEQRGTYRVESVKHAGDNRSGSFASSAVIRDPTAIF